MKMLFVSDDFQVENKTDQFFIDIIKEFFDVTIVRFNSVETSELVKIINNSIIDIVIIWKLDFLSPLFIFCGIRTIVVPSFDISIRMPDLHWLWATKASFVSFSRLLDERLRRLGLRTLRLKYFAEPAPAPERPSFDSLRVFLWQRRPEQGINLHLIEDLFGSQLDHVHIHDVADDQELDTTSYLTPRLSSYLLTTSKFAPTQADYQALRFTCNVSIIPELTENVGHDLIEDMARGMLVVASDAPIHDEYIANGVNGILFNPGAPGKIGLSLDAAESIAELGWQTVSDGRQKWLASIPHLIAFIQATPAPTASHAGDLAALARGLIRSYLAGVTAYSAYLLNQSLLISQMSGIDLQGRLGPDGRLQPEQSTAHLRANASLPWLSQNRIDFTKNDYAQYLIDPEYTVHDGALWLDTSAVSLGFRLDFGLGPPGILWLESSQCGACKTTVGVAVDRVMCVSLNGWTLGSVLLNADNQRVSLRIPPKLAKIDNVLRISVNYDPVHTAGSIRLHRCVFE